MRAPRKAPAKAQGEQDLGNKPVHKSVGRPRHRTVPEPDTRSTILNKAEALLGEQGYLGLSMGGLAGAIGLSVGTLYYHFPGGKEALTLAVAERSLERLGSGLAEALVSESGLNARLEGVARFILGSSRHTERVLRDTRRYLPTEHTQITDARFMAVVFGPLEQLLRDGVERGLLLPHDTAFRTWSFLGLLQAFAELSGLMPLPGLSEKIVDVLLGGLEPEEIG
jgi:AcrR family transcriptional regulator